jgi:hypothetical protein
VLQANNPHTLNIIIEETEMNSKWPDTRGNAFSMKWTTRIGFWNVRTLREHGKLSKRQNSIRLESSEIQKKR